MARPGIGLLFALGLAKISIMTRANLVFLTSIFGLFSLAAHADAAAANYRCDFRVAVAPFATLEFSRSGEGELSRTVRVTHYGKAHQESLTQEAPLGDELIHAVLSKESEENSIELFVERSLDAKMVNHHAPPSVGEMHGACVVL